MEVFAELLVGQKADGLGPSQRLLWMQSVGRAASVGLEETVLGDVVMACESPRDLSRIAELMGSVPSCVALFGEAADATEGGTGVLIRALVVLLNHLEPLGRHTRLEVALGYLACCEESRGRDGISVGLPEAVTICLQEYGFDG